MEKYMSFKQLAAKERLNGDYRIRTEQRDSSVLVIAPHGGGIEPGTSEIAEAIAATDFSYYLFEGLKGSGNRDLHITSTSFDEPRALALLDASDTALAIHGEDSDVVLVFLGGRDAVLVARIEQSLREIGFQPAKHSNSQLQGCSPENVCNRCASKAGVQMEIPKGLRKRFFKSLDRTGRSVRTNEFSKFVSAVRKALHPNGGF